MKYLRRLMLSAPIFIILLFSIQPVFGQVKGRIIPFPDRSLSSEDPDKIVLELIEVRVAGKPINLDERFEANENWIKQMTLVIKNVSKRSIAVIGLGGELLEGIDKELKDYQSFPYSISWTFGKQFDVDKEKPRGPILKPGETIELNYTNVDLTNIKLISNVEEGTFCKLKFMFPVVQYEDGEIDFAPRIKFYKTKKP